MPDTYPALFVLLREAHVSAQTALSVCGAITAMDCPTLTCDDLASALLRWRRECVNKRLARLRVICKDLLESVEYRDGKLRNESEIEHPYQVTLEDFLAQLQSLSGNPTDATA